MTPDHIIEKIRALRALATSNNVHEALAASAQAQRLAERHRIDEAELLVLGGAPDEEVTIDGTPAVEWKARAVTWQSHLVGVLAKHNGCAVYHEPARHAFEDWVALRVIGRPSDTAVVRDLYAWIALEIGRLATAASRGQRASWRTSWCTGAVVGLDEQLSAARQQVRATAPASSTALERIDDRATRANDLLRDVIRPRQGRASHAKIDPCAYSEGVRHGKALHLGKALSPKGPVQGSPHIGMRSCSDR